MFRTGNAEEQLRHWQRGHHGAQAAQRKFPSWPGMTGRMKTTTERVKFGAGDALIVIDVQKDFLPGGSLPVAGSEAVIPMLNHYLAEFARRHLPIYATRDWHPQNHCSFLTQGGGWPVHCVANSKGAEFASDLVLPSWTVVISKGVAGNAQAYSGFEGTHLEKRLRGHGIRRLFIGGLATDYCVLNTVKDALGHGFNVFVLRDAIHAVNMKPGNGAKAEAEMFCLGAIPIRLENIAT